MINRKRQRIERQIFDDIEVQKAIDFIKTDPYRDYIDKLFAEATTESASERDSSLDQLLASLRGQ